MSDPNTTAAAERVREKATYLCGNEPRVGDILEWADDKPNWLSAIDVFTVKGISREGHWLCIAEDFHNSDDCGWRPIRFRLIRRAATNEPPAPTPDAKLVAAAANFAITSLLGAAAVLDDVPGKSPNAKDCRSAADALAAALTKAAK